MQAANEDEVAPSKPSRLVEQVIAYLRDHVASEQLRPGARLPSETTISETLGVSRPVVREAMRTLAATGLVEMAVGKRATIVPVDGTMMSRVISNAVLIGQANERDILELRRGVEIAMVVLAAQHRSAEQAAELESIVVDMARHIDDAERYLALDLRLHVTLAEATGNPLYSLLIDALRQLILVAMSTGRERWSEIRGLDRVQELHEQIVRAVVAGDPAAAAAAMAQHFDDALTVILAPLAAKSEATSGPH
ncbi:FadR/GntR family transcriptional regulator [Sphingomonas suaedae]|uniref:FadR/GntR family transcriptional regulator n=1 Tax=Sphingomonas suaedae TaxID=2599297 RepID=UPI001644C138|nr:FCD domain-containing protein [Sphingomonas suaedae]